MSAAAELARQAALPLPDAARRGVDALNAGAFFEQHEHFEEAWRAEHGPVRELYQGLLQAGVAFFHIERRNYAGARKVLLRARRHLADLPAVCQGVDVAGFRACVDACLAALERLGAEGIAEFDRALFCRVRLVQEGAGQPVARSPHRI